MHLHFNSLRKIPEKEISFYQQLDKLLPAEKKSKYTVLLLGDFNAQTWSGYQLYKGNMSKLGQGPLNNNGEYLLNTSQDNNMLTTKICFPHKLMHDTTWTSPQRKGNVNDHDGTIKHNPYRNQIDYIIIMKSQRSFKTNSCCYCGSESQANHKFIKSQMRFE